MIKATIDKSQSVVAASGTTQDIVAELGLMVGRIYNAMKERNPRNAGVFRIALQAVVSDASPIWQIDTAPDLAIVMERPAKSEE